MVNLPFADDRRLSDPNAKPTILVVDDEPLLRQAVADLLEDSYEVLTAESGEEGLRLLADHPDVAVIVSDQRMPGMNGTEFLEHTRNISRAARILITGFSDIDAVVSAVNLGKIHGYLPKPFETTQLRTAIGGAHHSYQSDVDLRHERELLRGLMDSVPELISFKDAERRFIRVNQAMADCLGIDKVEKAIGKNESDFSASQQMTGIIAAEKLATENGGGVISRDWCLEENGSERWWATTVAPINAPSHAVGGLVTITRNITARKTAEKRLHQTQKMEAIANLTGGLAHDFNNLLAIIIGNLDLLADTPKIDESARKLLDDATAAALRGAELTHSLLAFSRRQPLQPKRFDINGRVAEMMNLLRRLLGEDIETAFSPGKEMWSVEADPAQLESALANLAANARDAMPSGGRYVVETRNAHLDDDYVLANPDAVAGDYVLIQASDTGCGMPAHVIARVIEPFFTTKPVGKGTGLGLSMVYGFVKQSDGHFKIYSEVGHGTTVRIYLPRADGDAPSDVATTAVATSEGGKIILVIDDNVEVRRIAMKQLTNLGHHIHEANNGQEALLLLEQLSHVDLLFTDVVMPGGMTGIDLARVARTRWPTIKVLFTSGFPLAVMNDGMLGPDDLLLNKPYRQQDLAHHVAEALKR